MTMRVLPRCVCCLCVQLIPARHRSSLSKANLLANLSGWIVKANEALFQSILG